MKQEPTIALLGCGYTLVRVAVELAGAGLLATSRTDSGVRALRARGLTAAKLDLNDTAEIERLFSDHPALEVIVDGIPPLERGADGSGAAFGSRSVADVLRGRPGRMRRLIYLSTTGVYGGENGAAVLESSKLSPLHRSGRARLECEEAYRTLPFEVCALRVTAIYGPGRGIGTAIAAGTYRVIGDGSRWSNRIQVDDLAAAIAAAVRHDGALPPALNATDGAPAQIREIVDYYCTTFDLPQPASMSLEEAKRRVHASMLTDQRVDGTLILRTLGLSWRYPSYREGAATEFSNGASHGTTNPPR